MLGQDESQLFNRYISVFMNKLQVSFMLRFIT